MTPPGILEKKNPRAADDLRVEFRSDPRLLRAIRGMVRGYLQNMGLDAPRIADIVLALDEACTNSMRHAYEGRRDGRILLTANNEHGGVVFMVEDDGITAPDKTIALKESLAPAADDVRPGGLGIQLIRDVFDEVLYSRGPEKGNRVVMFARLA